MYKSVPYAKWMNNNNLLDRPVQYRGKAQILLFLSVQYVRSGFVIVLLLGLQDI